MGFIDDIKFILSKISSDKQLSLFSATIDDSVMNVCHRFMKNPEKVLVSKDEIALEQLDQYYIILNPRNKLEYLFSILNKKNIDKAIIFCNTRRGTDWLAHKLSVRRYYAEPLHAGFTQAQRERITRDFRKGKFDFLIATDVAARGLDIQGISHIINYDVPLDALVYFHRIGRTARKGSEGTAITLVGYGEIEDLNKIKTLTNTNIKELEPINPPHY
jgi:ATP-dependent RNA helicase DeaD